MNILTRKVLVLNRVWQVVHQTTVQQALSMMAADAATALEINGPDNIRPVQWSEWLSLPPASDDEAIHTPRLKVRVPTVIVAVNYAGMPKRRPKLTLKTIAERDGYSCQYTGEKLATDDMSIDHVTPRSRGGKNDWKNVVLAKRSVNQKKGSKTVVEAGLKLLKKPVEPLMKPAAMTIKPTHPDHKLFLT